MKPAVLVYAWYRNSSRYGGWLLPALAERYAVLDCGTARPEQAFDAAQRAGIRVMVSLGAPVDRQVLDGLPDLRMISCYGSGFEHIDMAAVTARNIVVTNTPAANADAVADLAIALTLAVTRDILVGDQFIRSGQWAADMAKPPMRGLGMTGTRIGIFGFGAIGLKIAARAAAFGADVGYHSRTVRNDVPYRYFASLPELADWSDILQVAVRASPDTYHAVGREILRRLGPEGYVVNTSRGSVVDEATLVDALRNGEIAGAGLDVFENEPRVSPDLLTAQNVVMTPHLGSETDQAHATMTGTLLQSLDAFFMNGTIPFLI